jgi:UDPglucose--hexose-1-phosphate uridylyltransferase
MPELRRDDLGGRWVLLAPGRAARPHTFPPPARSATEALDECPFCPGHENMTPPEVYRTGEGGPDTPGWRVRVVPNLYPIVDGTDAGPGATGAHEVVVFSPSHDNSFAQLDEDEAVEVLTVARDRARHHIAAGHAYVQVVINHGRAAGASIAHPHAQIVALDVVPPAVARGVERFEAAASDLVVADLDRAGDDLRVLDGPVTAWCPWAGSTPYEMRLALRSAGPRFDEAGDGDVEAVAKVARGALARLAVALGDVPYNLVVYSAQPGAIPRSFHWYIEVQTRITVVAGFEQGTGILVNTVSPETAAQHVREATGSAEPE